MPQQHFQHLIYFGYLVFFCMKSDMTSLTMAAYELCKCPIFFFFLSGGILIITNAFSKFWCEDLKNQKRENRYPKVVYLLSGAKTHNRRQLQLFYIFYGYYVTTRKYLLLALFSFRVDRHGKLSILCTRLFEEHIFFFSPIL